MVKTVHSHWQSTLIMELDWLWLIVPGAYILISTLLLCFTPCPKRRHNDSRLNALLDSDRILCIGHRGGGFEGPQNTLELFRSTSPVSHMFELDVCQTLDHQLVVHHDSHLARTTGVNRQVNEYEAESLPKFQEEIQAFGSIEKKIIKTQKNTIPTLDRLFQEFPHMLMNIDLKTPTPTAIQEFARVVRKHNRQDTVVWGSMGDQGCTELRQAYPQVPSFYSGWEIFKIFLLCITGLLPFWPVRPGVLDIPLYTSSLNQLAYNFAGTNCRKILVCIVLAILRFFNLMSRLFIPHLRKRGILTFYWILNEREDWEKAISMGCRGIMTDEPSKLSAFLKEKQLYF